MAHIVTSLISTTLIMSFAFAELDALLCDRAMFDYGVYNVCVPTFNELMATVNYQDGCPWPSTLRYYSNLEDCVQGVVKMTACAKTPLKSQFFLDVHRTYFLHCPYWKDPDVLMLLLFSLPCVIITFLFPIFYSYFTNSISE
ncbi:hypothetical protein KOW79_004904 [Hemibagrus wyckioides]|uniref:Uncharacterized protein n=1 Tax=Hemibagrus wyckioides TaxID=337641 RepID=A0A9D3SPN9_9TELE|nr:receptor activity-modifying protein 1-like [Hemibagrus wyckioides]KAG7330935.1 hypothetical protein KOW79_004904 [Hemibagrus wyckioides]